MAKNIGNIYDANRIIVGNIFDLGAEIGPTKQNQALSITTQPGVYYRQSHLSNLDKGYSIYTARLGSLKIAELEWRRQLTIEQQATGTDYILYLPSTGVLEQRINEVKTANCSPALATIVNPEQELLAVTSERGQVLIIGIERQSLEEALAKSIDRSSRQPLIFDSTIDLASGFGVNLKEFVRFLCLPGELQETSSSCLVREELEQALLACLLKGFNHNYSDEICYHTEGASAYYVRKATAFIQSHLEEDITLTDIADAVGVCPRVLQKAFSQCCDRSPMRFLAQTRLYQIRRDLENPIAPTNVTDVMMRYGFTQGGKFAKEYYNLFGEKPSATIKRSKSASVNRPCLWQEIDDRQSEIFSGGAKYPAQNWLNQIGSYLKRGFSGAGRIRLE
jgi:AraC-like DNA-binding protein